MNQYVVQADFYKYYPGQGGQERPLHLIIPKGVMAVSPEAAVEQMKKWVLIYVSEVDTRVEFILVDAEPLPAEYMVLPAGEVVLRVDFHLYAKRVEEILALDLDAKDKALLKCIGYQTQNSVVEDV